MRKRLVISVLVGAALFGAVPTATAGSRADTYYTVHCTDPDGNAVVAESVDARAIEQGGKRDAIKNFNDNHPGWNCWPEGPFTN